jgi:hypothetical protein
LVPGCFILRTSLLLLYSFYYTPFFTKMQAGKFLVSSSHCSTTIHIGQKNKKI